MMTFEEGTKTVKIRICQLILYLYNFYDWIYLKNEGNTIVWKLYWRTIESTVRNCLKKVEYLQPIKTHKNNILERSIELRDEKETFDIEW